MNTFLSRGNGWVAAIIAAVCMFAIVSVVQAATTISTNISTGGTLAVTGASTLTGAVSAARAGETSERFA